MPAVRVLALAVLCLALGSLAVALGRDGIGLGQNGEWVLIRLPRVLGALAAGWALGIAGCAQQGLFRNPLADPGLTGVFGGALLGVTLLLCAAPDLAWDNRWALPIAAASGALAAMSALLALGRGRSVAGLLLAGLGINALAGAATLLAMTWAEGERGSIVTAQLGGWLGMLTPELAALPSLIGIVAGLLLLTQARGLAERQPVQAARGTAGPTPRRRHGKSLDSPQSPRAPPHVSVGKSRSSDCSRRTSLAVWLVPHTDGRCRRPDCAALYSC